MFCRCDAINLALLMTQAQLTEMEKGEETPHPQMFKVDA